MRSVTDSFAGNYDVAAVLATDPSLFHNIRQVLGVIGGRAKEPICRVVRFWLGFQKLSHFTYA
jgi:hypothetical protein